MDGNERLCIRIIGDATPIKESWAAVKLSLHDQRILSPADRPFSGHQRTCRRPLDPDLPACNSMGAIDLCRSVRSATKLTTNWLDASPVIEPPAEARLVQWPAEDQFAPMLQLAKGELRRQQPPGQFQACRWRRRRTGSRKTGRSGAVRPRRTGSGADAPGPEPSCRRWRLIFLPGMPFAFDLCRKTYGSPASRTHPASALQPAKVIVVNHTADQRRRSGLFMSILNHRCHRIRAASSGTLTPSRCGMSRAV
jgi:hypothetical protein